jgi:hypothetical protein
MCVLIFTIKISVLQVNVPIMKYTSIIIIIINNILHYWQLNSEMHTY